MSRYPKKNIYVAIAASDELNELMNKLMRDPGWKSCTGKTDAESYENLHRWYVSLKGKVPQHVVDLWRGRARVKEFQRLFEIAHFNPSGREYLDFGAGSAVLSAAIGRAFKMHTSATDIEQWHSEERGVRRDGVVFKFLDSQGRIPFTGKFDVISCLMVLHHIRPRDIKHVVGDIVAHLNAGGLFILREHDCRDAHDAALLHVEHAVHQVVIRDESFSEFTREYLHNYHNVKYWTTLVENAGLKLVFTGQPQGTNRYIYMLFKALK